MRLPWLALGVLALLGCGVTRAPLPGEYAEQAKSYTEIPSVPSVPSVASARSPEITPEPDTLTLTAECLERGDHANAAIHLEAYVCGHPEQIMFRAQLAELLIRVGRDATAMVHYERFIADAQTSTGAPRDHLVTAHTRLMEIAQRSDDRFAELFHRGVGLLLLVKHEEKLADADDGFGEEMLCKAIKSLAVAKELNPTDARTRMYLAEAYERSGNRRAANAERVGARLAPIPGQLTLADRQKCLLVDNSAR